MFKDFFSARPVARAPGLVMAVVASLLLTACVTTKTIPDGYTGPIATIRDSVKTDYEKHSYFLYKNLLTRADFFYVSKIDGKRIRTSVGQTAGTSSGLAFKPAVIDRQVPARKVTVTIEGKTHFAAPIQELTGGKTYPVSGEVTFTPRPNGVYVVRGKLRKGGSSVWIENAKTGRAVSKRIRL